MTLSLKYRYYTIDCLFSFSISGVEKECFDGFCNEADIAAAKVIICFLSQQHKDCKGSRGINTNVRVIYVFE